MAQQSTSFIDATAAVETDAKQSAIATPVSTTRKLGTIARVDWVQMMKEQLSAVRWKRLSLATVAGVVLLMAATTAYDQWRKRDGWCVQYSPDGSEKLLYGSECGTLK